jgi:hypothetical protein
MAGTSYRRWMLLPVLLAALLANYGDGASTSITFERDAEGGRLWQCPRCGRVERSMLPRPRCRGTPEKGHEKYITKAEPLDDYDDDEVDPTDDRQLFF